VVTSESMKSIKEKITDTIESVSDSAFDWIDRTKRHQVDDRVSSGSVGNIVDLIRSSVPRGKDSNQ